MKNRFDRHISKDILELLKLQNANPRQSGENDEAYKDSLSEAFWTNFGKPFQAARRALGLLLTMPRMLEQHVSSKLLRKVSMKMKEKGVTVGMEEIFREGPYIVF